MGACGVQALLISPRIMPPVFPLVNVRDAEFPVLLRLINAFKKALSLFVFRQMEEELDDLGAVTVEMLLQVHDRAIGCLKLKTSQPCGLTPDMTCLMAPSLPAESIA